MRTYTLPEAAAELHLSEETILEALEQVGIDRTGPALGEITEEELNLIVEKLNATTEEGK